MIVPDAGRPPQAVQRDGDVGALDELLPRVSLAPAPLAPPHGASIDVRNGGLSGVIQIVAAAARAPKCARVRYTRLSVRNDDQRRVLAAIFVHTSGLSAWGDDPHRSGHSSH